MNKRRQQSRNTCINQKDKFMLIPQYTKYVNVYNSAPPTNIPNPNEKVVNRIIVRKPVEESSNKDSDDLIKNMLGSILGSLDGDNGMPIFSKPDISKNTKETQKETTFIRKIDRTNMEIIDECPETIDDLIELSSLIDTKYDIKKQYNIDLKSLQKIIDPLKMLKKMIGLDDVKQKIVDIILFYLQGLDIKNQDMLHTIIDGPPGSGKTEIAHIYSKILCGLGLLSKGHFKKAKRHDFIGGYLGHTSIKTNKLLEDSLGGVLFIDEIYSIGNNNGKEGRDIYAKEFVDLLMEFMTEHKSDFVLVVAGYKNDIEKCFLSMNDGLERRFPIHFSIEDYSDDEMRKILLKKVLEYEWKISEDAIPEGFFEKNKRYFKYFGGDLETFITKCKFIHSRNLVKNPKKEHRMIDRKDFLDGFELYKQNPEIKKRAEQTIITHMYN